MKQGHNCKVNILRVTESDDTIGGDTGQEAVLHYQLPCRLYKIKGTEREVFKKEGKVAGYRMHCNSVDITSEDIVVDASGNRYEILDVDTPCSKFMTLDLSIVK